MNSLRFTLLSLCLTMTGCVAGYGGCLFTQPFSHTLTGRVHFRTFPQADGVDRVPILDLDRTEYVYSPARSLSCLPVNDLQLTGFSEFPDNVGENQRVTVDGRLFEATSGREHTRFAMEVTNLLPIPGKLVPKAADRAPHQAPSKSPPDLPR